MIGRHVEEVGRIDDFARLAIFEHINADGLGVKTSLRKETHRLRSGNAVPQLHLGPVDRLRERIERHVTQRIGLRKAAAAAHRLFATAPLRAPSACRRKMVPDFRAPLCRPIRHQAEFVQDVTDAAKSSGEDVAAVRCECHGIGYEWMIGAGFSLCGRQDDLTLTEGPMEPGLLPGTDAS